MYSSCLPSQTWASSLLDACRLIGLITFFTVAASGLLGFAISLHMAQVFDRVTTVHAAVMQPVFTHHMLSDRKNL